MADFADVVINVKKNKYKTAIGNFNSSNGELRRLNVTAGRGGKSYMSYQKVSKRLDCLKSIYDDTIYGDVNE